MTRVRNHLTCLAVGHFNYYITMFLYLIEVVIESLFMHDSILSSLIGQKFINLGKKLACFKFIVLAGNDRKLVLGDLSFLLCTILWCCEYELRRSDLVASSYFGY